MQRTRRAFYTVRADFWTSSSLRCGKAEKITVLEFESLRMTYKLNIYNRRGGFIGLYSRELPCNDAEYSTRVEGGQSLPS
jgi:hypothetical protein